MRKLLSLSLIFILLPLCTSFGAVGQTQGYLLGGDNGVALLGGPPGAAQNVNVGVVAQNQQSNNPYSFVTALQTQNGTLVQSASAVGMNGLFGVGQVGDVLGGQLQTVDGPGLGLQDQFLTGNFAQDVVRMGGTGAAVGIQDFTGLQVQMVISPYGASANAQYLGVGLADAVGGGP
jgi:hypothetical protein